MRVDRDVTKGVTAALNLGGVEAQTGKLIADEGPAGWEPTVDTAVGRVADVVLLSEIDSVGVGATVVVVVAHRQHAPEFARSNHGISVLAGFR